MEATLANLNFLNRLRSLQWLCSDSDTNCPKGILVMPGPDGRFNPGSIHIIKYLFQGSIGRELQDDVLKEEMEDLEDIVLLIKERTVSIMYSSKMKIRISSMTSLIPFLVEYTYTDEEENDIDKFQLRKCINFKRTILESLKDGDCVGITVPSAYEDIMEVEQWPLLQAFALDSVFKSTGFFTARYTVADVSVSVETLYRTIDGLVLMNAVKMVNSMVTTYMQEMLSVLDCPTISQRQRLIAEDVAGPIQVLFEFGELDSSGVVENMMKPVVLFGTDTNDLSALNKQKDWERNKVGSALHMIVESSEPSSGMRWCRTYFMGSGNNSHLLDELQKMLRFKLDSSADNEGEESVSLTDLISIDLFKRATYYGEGERIMRRMSYLYVKLCLYLRRFTRKAFVNSFDILAAATDLQEKLTVVMTKDDCIVDKDLTAQYAELSSYVLLPHERLQIHMDCMNASGEVVTADEIDELGGACWIYIRVSIGGLEISQGKSGTIAVGDTFLFSPLVHQKIRTSFTIGDSVSHHVSHHVNDGVCITQTIPYFRTFLGNEVEECYSRCVNHCLRSSSLTNEFLGLGRHLDVSGVQSTAVTLLTNHPLLSVFRTSISLFQAGFTFDKINQNFSVPIAVSFAKDVDRVWSVDLQDALIQAKASFYPQHSAKLFASSKTGLLLILGLKESSLVYNLLPSVLTPSAGYVALFVSYDDPNANMFREVLERWKVSFRMNDILDCRGSDFTLPSKILASVLDLVDKAGLDDSVKDDFGAHSLIQYASLALNQENSPVPGVGEAAMICSHLLAEAQRLSPFDYHHLPILNTKHHSMRSKTLVVAGQIGCGVHLVAKLLSHQLLTGEDSSSLTMQVINIDFSACSSKNNDVDIHTIVSSYIENKLNYIDQRKDIVMIVLLLHGRIQQRFSDLLTIISSVSKRRIHQVISVISPATFFQTCESALQDISLGREFWKSQALELLQPHCSSIMVAVDSPNTTAISSYDLMRNHLSKANPNAYLIKLSPQTIAFTAEEMNYILGQLLSNLQDINDREAASMLVGYPLQYQSLGSNYEQFDCTITEYPVFTRLSIPTLSIHKIDNVKNLWMVNILLKLFSSAFFPQAKLHAYKIAETWGMKKAASKNLSTSRLVEVAAGKIFSCRHTQLMEEILKEKLGRLHKDQAEKLIALSTSILSVYAEVFMTSQKLSNEPSHHHSEGEREVRVVSVEANEAWISLHDRSLSNILKDPRTTHSYMLVQGMFTASMIKLLEDLVQLCERVAMPKKSFLTPEEVTLKRKYIQNLRRFEERELPFGWFFDGSFFVDSSGNRSELRPDIDQLVEEYLHEENRKINRYNQLLDLYDV